MQPKLTRYYSEELENIKELRAMQDQERKNACIDYGITKLLNIGAGSVTSNYYHSIQNNNTDDPGIYLEDYGLLR